MGKLASFSLILPFLLNGVFGQEQSYLRSVDEMEEMPEEYEVMPEEYEVMPEEYEVMPEGFEIDGEEDFMNEMPGDYEEEAVINETSEDYETYMGSMMSETPKDHDEEEVVINETPEDYETYMESMMNEMPEDYEAVETVEV